MSEWLIETENLTKVYQMGETEVQALRGVSMRVAAGEFLALTGASGSGKSTLMHLLGCLDTPTAGCYRLQGRDVSQLSDGEQARVRNTRIGFVFQSFNLLPRISALENVTLPLLYRGRVKRARERAGRALERVGLVERTAHRPTELSGGERQRVAIARALATDPAIILADEPTGNLDSVTGDELLRLLAGLHAEGRTILIVTHDAQVAARAQRTLHMRDGQIVHRRSGDVAL
jgi:putative ABC transport system ATP-binding protein